MPETYPMNLAIRDRLAPERPTDQLERFFWLIDKINLVRSCRWRQEMYENYVRELEDVAIPLFTDWLRTQGAAKELPMYEFVVLPYISFRFFNAPAAREVDILTASTAQRKRLVDYLAKDDPDIPDSPMYRAVLEEAIRKLLIFFGTLRRQREQ